MGVNGLVEQVVCFDVPIPLSIARIAAVVCAKVEHMVSGRARFVVVEAATQARIVVIDIFFGQQVRIKLQIAFVDQALLPDDVGVAVVVEMTVGG